LADVFIDVFRRLIAFLFGRIGHDSLYNFENSLFSSVNL
jgi:hypothetical protein